MSVLEYLIQAKVPAWAAITLVAVAALGMGLYAHFLGRQLKRLEHRLQTQAISQGKLLDFVQDRHRKRLEALDTLNGLLMEFDHAVRHVREGDLASVKSITEHFARARSFARASESLLGTKVYEAVLKYTDGGRSILDAQFCITERTARVLEFNGLPSFRLEALQRLIGTRHRIPEEAEQIVAGYPDEIMQKYRRTIFATCDISEEFEQSAYDEARGEFRELKVQLLRTLPTLQMDPWGNAVELPSTSAAAADASRAAVLRNLIE